MLAPLRKNTAAQATARGHSIRAPVKGWNARDGLDGMDPGYAVVLDNYFPQEGYVGLRKGSAVHATGIGSGDVESLLVYNSGGTEKLLAFGNDAIYDASSSGAVGAALASSLTNNRWQGVNFNSYLIMVNGADTPRKYNGTLSTTTFTGSGLTATDLVNVAAFKNRLFFAENNSASFWYGGLNSISGTLTEFNLANVHSQGGDLMAIGTMTGDGGDGPDDRIVFVMETGSVIVYAGTDPGDATAWSLIGTFYIGAPVGRRCLLRLGAELAVITADGFVPLSPFLRFGRGAKSAALSDAIVGAVNDAVRDYKSTFGWQPILYPKGTMALFNVPVVASTLYHQYVVNTATGAWCRFKGLNGICWAVYGDDLYFGGIDGKVKKADTGFGDEGSNIEGDAQTAYDYMRARGRLKRFTMYRPVVAADGNLPIRLGLGVDFDADIPTFEASSITTEGAVWDDATWDVDPWAEGLEIQKPWQTAANIGYSASVRIRTSTNVQQVRWYSTDILYEPGGYV